MKITDVIQRTPPWERWRAQGVTASEAAIVLGRSPYKTLWRLWAERTGLAREADEVTAAQLAVDDEVEQGHLAGIAGHLQTGADGPDLPELQGWLLADQFALVPRRVRGGRRGGGVGHGLSPLWLVRKQKLGAGTRGRCPTRSGR